MKHRFLHFVTSLFIATSLFAHEAAQPHLHLEEGNSVSLTGVFLAGAIPLFIALALYLLQWKRK